MTLVPEGMAYVGLIGDSLIVCLVSKKQGVAELASLGFSVGL